MNLIIDVGNTFIKLAVFENDTILHKKKCVKSGFLNVFYEIITEFSFITDVIVSSVGNFTTKDLSEIKKKFKLVVLTHKTSIPFVNKYQTPKTLGIDRIALVSAAAVQFSKKNVLIIDVGSCITYDFLNSENEYLGGAISPGITLRYKSLNAFTDKLPLLEPEVPENLIGNATNTSIHIGVVSGIINEMDGFIDAYKEKHKKLTIILTGGGAHFLLDSLKNDIFANSNFLLEGLNHILENNKNKC